VITIIGALAFLKLPISEYPEVVPPTVVVADDVSRREPGSDRGHCGFAAGAGDHRRGRRVYMFSQATADGVMTLTITFRIGNRPGQGAVQVQNRVAQTLPRLPQEVQRLGGDHGKNFAGLADGGPPDFAGQALHMLYLANYAVAAGKR